MNRPGRAVNAFPVEDFVQSLSAQLDRAQDALALKARTGRPLTFALKDLAVELKVFWEVQSDGRLLMRHAGPNESGASTVSLAFTTITREMVEENTISFGLDEDARAMSEIGGDDALDEQDQRRLELVGVRTVGQFRRMMDGADAKHMESLLGTPVGRLRAALERSSQPVITGQEVVRRPDGRPLLRINGANLASGDRPRVKLQGEPVEVLDARGHQLLVRPLSHHVDGRVEVEVGERTAEGFFDLGPTRARSGAHQTAGEAP